jgi:hypothetical protein
MQRSDTGVSNERRHRDDHRKYVELRDDLERIESEAKAKKAPVAAAMETLGNVLLKLANDQGVTSFKTGSGTAFRQTVTRASVQNWDAMLIEHVKATGDFHLLTQGGEQDRGAGLHQHPRETAARRWLDGDARDASSSFVAPPQEGAMVSTALAIPALPAHLAQYVAKHATRTPAPPVASRPARGRASRSAARSSPSRRMANRRSSPTRATRTSRRCSSSSWCWATTRW